ncbi:MAG: Pyruvate carboxylase subunit A [Methanosaeta sp. PtaB.Bin039]|nr:MAG: Pyruvate carboxylase subunit A [Methanosaeta sp. PtaB.Bin039]OPY44321.1 MAG: Pyruvate carboxylase subunit A [Methanosaeta sp. PtaU1.Bin028]HOT06511.1 acetyl-CoA carboxylase biotin carboxylase subunit [Methanotrichaceae archaeon]HQF15616.1 acetyl-CoA carboxylase biotin carboxylase subunit [Methanotrichaceae archaeon]HQI90352.1 acetyl-CoA carboxylase biotin carboxylase subunit [Methanotrichaceae archaeon]
MFRKILVANRGEIAIRVMRACRELGVSSVAIYSEADKNALFANYADEAVFVGPSPTSQSYLKMENIIKAALDTGAEGIHPGYGFLSENPVFARLCEENGIVFIGPASYSIDAMGSKITARQTMKAAGVPIVPGVEKGISDPQEVEEIAEQVGFPIILKPAAGGGGIGMKIVDGPQDLASALSSSQSIARSAFGDDTVYVEKYLPEPRHIEFQIMADNRGNTVYVSERECSIQRRHQKLIEESPSPVMTPELRKKMGDIAVRAAKAIRYRSAGTVEFMYSRGNFYFLEMNTRLQVEHPITEMVTGIDLAKEQIMVASGEDLGFSQDEIEIRGWAIECRINAEDPLRDFAPSPGKLRRYRSPGGPGIRVDSGVYTGYVIPPYYDSLISKLVAHGRNRAEAIVRMQRALYEYIIVGVETNIAFHKAVLRNDRFRQGDINTHFIKEENIMDDVKKVAQEDMVKGATLASSLGADTRKIAAIAAAVDSYLSATQIVPGNSVKGKS